MSRWEHWCEDPMFTTSAGAVWLFRRGARARFIDRDGEQVGPELDNVASALAYAIEQGWQSETPVRVVSA